MGPDRAASAAVVLRDRADAEGYVASICFKHGPPRRYGVELEWTLHHADDPGRPLDPSTLARALGPHAPGTLADHAPDAPPAPLPHGSTVTVEPGGQVELSTSPHDSVAALLAAACADQQHLDTLLADAGLVRGDLALDGRRPPTRLLRTPRYAAMEKAFDRIGPHGTRMMCSTAAVQVCLDAGEPHQVPARWAALHGLGPVMVALFANSAAVDPDGRAWESARMQAVLRTDPARMLAPPVVDPTDDPATAWARRVLDTPLLCLRRDEGCWDAPDAVTFGDWVDGALPRRPTTDDLDYHLSTVFPPVRPRGYLEVRYVDAQPGTAWVTPVTLLAALMSREDTVQAVVEATASVVDLWFEAARQGLASPAVAAAAQQVLDLGCEALDAVDVPAALAAQVLTDLAHRRAALTPSKR